MNKDNSMSENVIESVALTRSFGNTRVVDNVSLTVKRGSVYGFLGRNGAGKSTFIKMLVGLIWPDSGELKVNGVQPRDFSVEDRQKVAYMSEKQILLPGMKVSALIDFTASFYPKWDKTVCDRILQRFKIDPRKRIKELSQGGARQVAFMLALAQKPEILILDEPAANLDVVARRDFLDEILDLIRQEGRTVFFSSHILGDIERVADQIGIVNEGRLCVSEPLDDLKETVKQVRFYNFEQGLNGFALPNAFQFRKENAEALATMRVRQESDLQQICSRHRCQFEVRDLGLEDIFVEIVKEAR